MRTQNSGAWLALRNAAFTTRRSKPYPKYKDKDGPRAYSKRSNFFDLEPEALMSPSEFKEMTRLMKLAQVESSGIEHPDWKVNSERIAQLAEAVLRRYIGVERYMVLDVERDDGHRVRMQVLDIDLYRGRWRTEWRWSLSGRALRKNLTIGSVREGTTFTSARIARRTLTGEWRRLSPVVDRSGRRYESRTR